MRKTLLLFSFIFCIVYGNAQQLITIGTGNINNSSTTYPAPYGNWFWGARHQFLILASELQAAGMSSGANILGLEFDVVTPNGVALQNFQILLGHTTQSDMSSWVPNSQLTTVYTSGAYTEVAGWNTHTFSSSFNWNGTDNLVVETCFNNSSYTNNAVMNMSSTSFVSSIWYFQDASGVCSSTNSNGTGNDRPNMRLSVAPSQPFDAGVLNILQPASTTTAGQSLPVQVTVGNFGLNPISNFDIFYSVNGIQTGTFTVTTTMNPGTTANYTMPNFTAPSGMFTLCAYTSLSGDGYAPNDTSCKSITGFPLITVTPTSTYTDNFDSGVQVWGASSLNQSTTWQLGTPNFGTTSSAYSPPNSWDVNLTTAYGTNATSYLYSPFFDMSSAVQPVLSFYQNRNTTLNNDGARIEFSINNGPWLILGGLGSGTNWYNSTSLSSSNMPGWSGGTNGWIKSTLNLPSAFNNQALVQFRFVFTSDGFTSSGSSDGMSIDDFEIFVPVALSAATQSVSLTNYLLLPGAPQTVNTQLKNKGTTALQNVNVTLMVDGNIIVTDNIQFAPVLPGFPNNPQVYNHTFSQPWYSTPGAHTVSVFTSNPNLGTDQNPSDDTTSITVTVFDSTGTPYCNDFDGSQPQWVSLNALSYSPNSSWEVGAPAQTSINTAYDGSNAWMTDLNSNYGPRDTSGLFSPVFTMSAGQCYKISFHHNFITEYINDGGTIEYSRDGTASWYTFGNYNQPNWYNTQYIAALGSNPPRPGWSGNSNGWVLAENYLGFTTQQSVIFRFRFASDMTLFDEGWAIDAFCFEEDANNQCLLISDIDQISETNGLMLDQNYPNPATSSTVISYITPDRADVSLKITNLLGQEVKILHEGIQDAGYHSIDVDLSELRAGIYYYSLLYNNTDLQVRKMIVTK